LATSIKVRLEPFLAAVIEASVEDVTDFFAMKISDFKAQYLKLRAKQSVCQPNLPKTSTTFTIHDLAQSDGSRWRFGSVSARASSSSASRYSHTALLDAQRNLFTAREELASNQLPQLQSQVQLYRALGGGGPQSVNQNAAIQQ
jgi:hypothetical protein